jgi:hypothetical protein
VLHRLDFFFEVIRRLFYQIRRDISALTVTGRAGIAAPS